MKLVPVMVNDAPPDADPAVGKTLDTDGIAKYVKWSSVPVIFVPLGLVTPTSTVPAD